MKQRRLVLALLSLLTLSAFGDDGVPELVFLPDVNNDKPLDLSDGKDQHIMYFPLWNREDHVQEYDGEWSYDISLGYNMRDTTCRCSSCSSRCLASRVTPMR